MPEAMPYCYERAVEAAVNGPGPGYMKLRAWIPRDVIKVKKETGSLS